MKKSIILLFLFCAALSADAQTALLAGNTPTQVYNFIATPLGSTFAGSANITTLGTISSGTWQGTKLAVGYGGTDATSFTAYSVLCGGTTSTGALQSVSGVGTTGQVLTSNGASALPSWQTPTSITYSTITADQSIAVGHAYVNNKSGSQLVLTLPSTASVGDIFQVVGLDSHGWKVAQNASQMIHAGATSSTTGTSGYASSNEQYDVATFVCTVTNNEWTLIYSTGTITLN